MCDLLLKARFILLEISQSASYDNNFSSNLSLIGGLFWWTLAETDFSDRIVCHSAIDAELFISRISSVLCCG